MKKEIRRNQNRRIRWLPAGLFLFCLLWNAVFVQTWAVSQEQEIEEPGQLYAQSAVLMDADSGRILFAKNAREERPMASTTKIMTCILALEYGSLDGTVVASAKAAAQPEVHLGVRQGMEFRLRDLLYSLMLESHNDAAVMIAEAVGTTVEGFADMMNQKARELGCEHTHYVTPNGLDASDEDGIHRTTAEDLARVMKYCIMDSPQRRQFLEITRTPSYQFTDLSGKSSYFCSNHNAFLSMMEGALSGKTGFTGNAGYCYVGSLKSDGRTFIVALLACGWPNNKSYKWADTRKLMEYGIANFHYQNIAKEVRFDAIPVTGGVPDEGALSGFASVPVRESVSVDPEKTSLLQYPGAGKEMQLLLRDDESVEVQTEIKKVLFAPVSKGMEVGRIRYLLHGEELCAVKIVTEESIEKRDFAWCFRQIGERFCME